MAQKRIFPIFLDASVQNVDASSGNEDWDGKSSRVLCTAGGAFNFDLGAATVPGTLVNIILDQATGAVTVDLSSGTPMGSTALDTVVLSSQGEGITVMWTGSEWFFMGSTESTVVS